MDFDFRIIDVFKKLGSKEMNIKDRILEEFLRVKEILGHRPSRVEFFKNIDDEVYAAIKKTKSSLNPLNDYLGFLKENGELFESEEALFKSIGHEFIKMIETTKMSKSYKITVFLAFYNDGNVKMEIYEDDIYRRLYEFYHKGTNKVDMRRDKGTVDFEKWDKRKWVKLAKDNPIKFLVRSHGEFFHCGEYVMMSFNKDMRGIIRDEVFSEHIIDAMEYRKKRYYEERKVYSSK